MKRNMLLSLLLIAVIVPVQIYAHCEIPCGIYNDKMRIDMLKEHVTTIEKSMNQIIELQKAETINYNQLVRWINNKDEHADEIQHIVTQYFMTQRIKPADGSDKAALEKYQKELGLLHEMLVYAMKTKQTTDVKNCTKLNELIDSFYNSYFSEEEKNHTH
ncbi:MAG: superoxide dismutase [Ni] [Calditrichaceae bacterium]